MSSCEGISTLQVLNIKVFLKVAKNWKDWIYSNNMKDSGLIFFGQGTLEIRKIPNPIVHTKHQLLLQLLYHQINSYKGLYKVVLL